MFNLEAIVEKNLLKYAVQRAMVCDCGQILDCRKNAALMEEKDPDIISGGFVTCIDCYYKRKEYLDELYKVQLAPKAKKYHALPDTLDEVPSSFAVFGANCSNSPDYYADGSVLIRGDLLKRKALFTNRLPDDYRYHRYGREIIEETINRYRIQDYSKAKLVRFTRQRGQWQQFNALFDIDDTCLDAAIWAQVRKYTKGLSDIVWIKDKVSPAILTQPGQSEVAALIMPRL